jgi:(1->4)-alpha-D-glucan 1-alpha-D-glucosylmutase
MARIPTGTYRVQLHADFGFDAAAEIADYLEALGISHLYSSPYLQAAPGSQHGYDVVDHHRVNEELGGAEAHDRFSKRLDACHLGQVLDIVPNHMAIGGRRNRYWWDVLENGASSRYASYFDIDWDSHEEKLRNKLLVPILGDHYGRVLTRGEVSIERNGGDFYVKYFDHELPAAPRSLPVILRLASGETGSDYLAFLADSLENLPAATATDSVSIAQRHRDKTIVNGLLDRLFAEVPFIAETLDSTLQQINKDPDRLHDFLEQQNFRLAYWRASEQDLGYRRFFDVNTLAGLRVEDPHVLSDSHALILKWLHEGILDGIRVDHPDGLRDPRLYFERLRAEAPGVWILGEKILEAGEKLRSEWPVDGTTGYDYLNQAGGLFVDSRNEEAFTKIYTEFAGDQPDYAAICRDKKHRVMRDLLGSDVNRLTSLFMDICEAHRDRRDYTRHDVIRAIRELVACFPVYRTYVVAERDEATGDDIHYVNEALEAAKENRQELDAELFDFLADVLLLKVRGDLESEFIARFQQFCGPVMAKGVEDTVFYDFVRLISLNEVGGDPEVFGVEPEQFHRWCEERQKSHPRAMLASSTHDTKRSEDVRARISVLSEIPGLWKQAVERWAEATDKYKRNGCPDRNTEYFLYQTMLGAWPIGTDRLLPYMEKACREGKRHTNWLTPNEEFEAATRRFVELIYKDQKFLKDFEAFVATVIEPGRINALAQVLLKLTAPGIPDIYQGTELWDLSLVDPDNRRPVDYSLRRHLVAELPHLKVDEVWQRVDEGLPKLWTAWHALRTRRQHMSAFGETEEYEPVYAKGSKADHVVAFLRGGEVLVVVPRLPVKLGGDWAETTIDIPRGVWDNVLTEVCVRGGKLQVKELFAAFPVALLVKR